MNHRSLFMLILIALGLGCQRRPAALSPEAVFPANNEAAGWARAGAVRTFNASELYKYIDGDAERFLQAGVVSVSTMDYRYRDKNDAVADVYVMGSPAGSEKIMQGESAAGSRPVDIGASGRMFGQSLLFCRGPFLVRLTAYDESPELQTGLAELGRAIDRKLR